MIAFVIGGAVLLVVLAALYAFAGASVAGAKRALLWSGGILAAIGGAVLLLSGRGGWLTWALVLLGPAAWRWWQGRRIAATFSAAASGDAVETTTLSMRLDPADGALSGVVRRGEWAGRDLADLPLPALRGLLAGCAADDPESVPLLEAWLDRAHPGWRDEATASPGPMTRAEALAILGLGDDAAEEAIRAAHARLMRAAHPDAGGSHWLAARLNAARDVLLGSRA
ncbi:hypothetical protein ACE7GA_16845 [Roseomonas sp. CCTCC AB2023176]|uniref:hypothetical protein n=1 Tax=Roseomonas sp. CCTCC AB2023176 TaxID=3342640 RepID=UPI0035DDC2D1